MDDVLTVRGVSVHFGALKAVSGVSLSIRSGQVLGLIGPNGAGKSTLFNAITGHVPVAAGQVAFDGSDITSITRHARARLGIARTFQLGGVVADLSVEENIALGLDHEARHTGRRLSRRDRRAAVRTWLERFEFGELAGELGGGLSAGARREVEILRAIASGARLVLLDEPGVGLSDAERRRLIAMVRRCASDGKAFLVTDHDTDIVFTVSDEVVALSFGRVIATGSPDEVRKNATVIDTYLGRGRTADE